MLVIFTISIGATLLFAYLWVACTALPKGILQSAGKDDDEEEEVREKLLKDWEAPVSSEHAEVQDFVSQGLTKWCRLIVVDGSI